MRQQLLLFSSGLLMLFLQMACVEFEEPVNRDKPKWEIFNSQNGLSSDTILSMSEDNEGTIWIGTTNGIYTKKSAISNQFEVFDSGYTVNKINCVDEFVLVATNLGAYIYVNDNWYFVNYELKNCIDIEFFDGSFWCLYGDGDVFCDQNKLGQLKGLNDIYEKNGTVWWCTLDGLIQFSQTTTTLSKENGLASNSCLTVFQDSKSRIWVGAFDEKGLSKIDKGKVINFDCGYIRTITEDLDGNIWAGSNFNGLYKIESNGNITNYTMLDGLPNNKITNVFAAKDGAIWVATEGGGIAKHTN